MYVDDSEETEFVSSRTWESIRGTISEHQASLRRAQADMPMPTSVKMGIVPAPQALRKRIEVDGLAGRASPSVRRILQHAGLTAWLLDQKDVSLVEMQGVCGRWASNFVLRRQTLSCLDHAWRRIFHKALPHEQGRARLAGRGRAHDVYDDCAPAGRGHAPPDRSPPAGNRRLGAGRRRVGRREADG